jgi:hypothetical protein
LHDLVLASQQAHAAVIVAQDDARKTLKDSEQRLVALGKEFRATDERLTSMVEQHVLDRGQPGDIVVEELSESGREVRLTAAMIRKIASARGQYVQALLRDREAAEARGRPDPRRQAGQPVRRAPAAARPHRRRRARAPAPALGLPRLPAGVQGPVRRARRRAGGRRPADRRPGRRRPSGASTASPTRPA